MLDPLVLESLTLSRLFSFSTQLSGSFLYCGGSFKFSSTIGIDSNNSFLFSERFFYVNPVLVTEIEHVS